MGASLQDASFVAAARLTPPGALRFCAGRCERLGILDEMVRRAPHTAASVGLGDHPMVAVGLDELGM